jgi:cell division transport system ATP-binding protein
VTPAIIKLQNADIYQFNNTLVLKDVNFQIAEGEFVYLIGRTGSGKSSLLKTLYADLWLEKGQGTVAGYSLEKLTRKELPYLRRQLGIVFQDFQLLPDRSVYNNLEYVLEATGWTNKSKMSSRIAICLLQVGLENTQNKFPHQLSGGEQQRVSIARALLNDPKIILADEPTGNLDPEVSEQIMKTFEAINAKGTAILMATHGLELIRRFPKRVIQCHAGQLIEQ